MFIYQVNIVPKWLVKDHSNYFVDDKNKMRNRKTGKLLQMQVKVYTKGYYFSGKFYSLTQIRPMLYKYAEKNKCPF